MMLVSDSLNFVSSCFIDGLCVVPLAPDVHENDKKKELGVSCNPMQFQPLSSFTTPKHIRSSKIDAHTYT